jgi:hypothetical protein
MTESKPLRFKKRDRDPEVAAAVNGAWDAVVKASKLSARAGDVGIRVALASALFRLLCDSLLDDPPRRAS